MLYGHGSEGEDRNPRVSCMAKVDNVETLMVTALVRICATGYVK